MFPVPKDVRAVRDFEIVRASDEMIRQDLAVVDATLRFDPGEWVKPATSGGTTKAAKMAMISNVGFALRSILRKNLPKDFKSRTGLDPANEHAVTTLLSSVIMIPFVLMSESIPDMMDAFSNMGANKMTFLTNLFLCGMSFYMYNEMQNKVLGALGPVPTAVGNTLKRVVIFMALYFFTSGETFPPAKVLGCAIAIAGCLSYAICNSKKI